MKEIELKQTIEVRSFPLTYEERDNSLSVTFSTGERVFRDGFRPYWEELSISNEAIDFSRLNRGAPLLKSHDQSLDSVIGVVENGRVENGVAVANVRFSNRDDVKPIIQDIKDGILRNLSVGYRIEKYEKVGEENDNPVIKATRWTPYELSIVSIPADKNAQVRSMDECPTNIKETIMDEKNTIEVKADENRSVEVQSSLSFQDAIAQERSRIADITKTVRSAGLPAAFGEDLIRSRSGYRRSPWFDSRRTNQESA